jgi:hypothetical protein
MSKNKNQQAETWGSRMKDWGGGDFTFLSSDGETITFVVVGLPVLMESHYKGQKGERIGCPVVTDSGYQLYVCGKRVARKLAKIEKSFTTNAIMVVRHGEEGDQNAKYAVKVLPEKETFDALILIARSDFEPAMIKESVAAATEVMQK